MTMKCPPHPGMGLKDDIEALGVSVAEAATSFGVARQYLQAVTRGKSAMTPDMALRLEKVIGSTAEHWLSLQLAHDLAQARLHSGKLKLKRLAPRAP
jgi:addiction module HigA family antidote